MLPSRALLLLGGAAIAQGYLPSSLPSGRSCGSCRRAADTVMMPGTAALAKKSVEVTQIKEIMEDSQLLFCVRSEGYPVNKLNALRQDLPEGVVMRCCKNTLVLRAAQDFERFSAEDLPSLLHYSNYWFFVPEESMKPAVEKWNDWTKENGFKDEAAMIVGGVFGGELLDSKGVEAISKLPTKQDLMGQTATLVKMVTSNLARSIDQAGAVRLARGLE